ncbi:MAG: HD domain-containing protein [Treponema sp.]|nr:HD domain-containing protein [Treponema sp.]
MIPILSVFSKNFSLNPEWKTKDFSAILYNNTSGLPTSEANTIVETEDGFIWIGSYSGLIRYDGKSFERIDSSKTGIANVTSMIEDSNGRLWIGTNDSGVAVMENNKFQMYSKKEGMPALSVRSIAEDEEGNIYIATTHGIVSIDKSMQLHTLKNPQINEENILMLKAGTDNTIFGVTRSGTVFSIKNKKIMTFSNEITNDSFTIHTILPDINNPGFLYLGTTGSEIYYGNIADGINSMKKISAAPLSYINSINRIGNSICVTADNGIGFIHENKVIPVTNVPMTTSIESMMSDYQGNLWFASSQQGIMKIVPNRFTDIFKLYNIEEEVVYTTCLHDDILFIGTKNSGLLAIQNEKLLKDIPITSAKSASGIDLKQKNLLQMLNNCRIRSIIKDSRNRLWFSTFSKYALVCYDNGNVLTFTQDDGLPSNRIRSICERNDGSIMACCTGGLAVINNKKLTAVYGDDSLKSNTEVMTAAQMNNGDSVLGTDGGGIYIIKTDNTILHKGIEDGLNSDVILRIKKDISKNILWIITSNSIAFITEDYKINTIKNFPYSNNFDLYQNSKGEMWILSSNGIYVTNVNQLLENKEITPLYYGMTNGLSCLATANSYSSLSQDGTLYIAGSAGTVRVNIEQHDDDISKVKMAVPNISADGTYINPNQSGKFIIPSNVKKITIYSYIFNYSLMNPQITYCLKGFEKIPTTIKRNDLVPVSYTNLKGGEYHFIIQIQDSHGNNIKSLDIPIVKQHAIWELMWVRIIILLLMLSVILSTIKFYISYRTNSFLKKENAQKQLIREIVEAFAKVIDMKDKYTNGHSFRVAEYTSMLAKELGYDDDTIEKYYNIALLHDIGKIGIPPEILNKPGKLTAEEFNIIKNHSALGYETLKDISIMPELATGAGAHHERPDGKGYPRCLKENEIPRVAQLIAVADTFDAMYSDRPYRKRMNFEKAVSIMKDVSGTQLKSDVVNAFLNLVKKGEFKAADDYGGGSTEDINNIRQRLNNDENLQK